MITCTNVVRRFVSDEETVTALDGVSITAPAGELTCLFGASGSGKSTLLNVMAGLDVPDEGDVRVGTHVINGLKERQRAAFRLEHIGVVFQDNNLIPEFTALENVIVPLEAVGHPAKAAKELGLEALDRMGVLPQADRRPSRMSGGQRQRVGIARALGGNKSIVVADEPTGALDSITSTALFQLLRRLADDGATVVVATHDPLARDFADAIITLQDGRLV